MAASSSERHRRVLGLKISEVYTGKVILITGATGFVGKVLLEKLIRSCPGISQIFLLLRSDVKKTCAVKFQDLLHNAVFDRIRQECPDQLNKMSWVGGDATKENLGLTEDDLKKVKQEVSFIFHCAASVRFDGDPKETFQINLVAVKNVLDICYNMERLQAFVHVSTAYSFCNRSPVFEEIYPENIAPKRIIDSLTWMNADQLKEFCKKIVNRPTLYHYSKALAEIYLAENAKTIPVVVVRPSVVTASHRDPFPGWIDNYNGPSGFIALSSKGVIRTLLVKDDIVANWVPVDIVANTLILAAYTVAVERDVELEEKTVVPDRKSGMPIINCVCPVNHSKRWFELIMMCIPLLSKYPSYEFYSQPGGGTKFMSKDVQWLRIQETRTNFPYQYFKEVMGPPLIRVPLHIWSSDRNVCESMVRNYKRIHGVMDNLHHYTTHQFMFCYSNMRHLIRNMTPEDEEIFPINQQAINWRDYMEIYVHGVRKYFLKESDDTLEPARSKLKRYQNICFYCKIAASIATLVYLNHCHFKITPRLVANYLFVSKYYVFGKMKS